MSNVSETSIQRSASQLRAFVFGAMVLIGALFLAARLNLQFGHAHFEYRLHDLGSPFEDWIAAGSLVLLLVALFRLTQMLKAITEGELFSIGVIRRFRGFAFWLLLMALFELVSPVIAGVLGAAASYPHRILLTLNLRDILTLGITLLLFLLARLLERARSLDEEMREFV